MRVLPRVFTGSFHATVYISTAPQKDAIDARRCKAHTSCTRQSAHDGNPI